MSFNPTRALRRPACIFLNSSRLNYDNKLDFSQLFSLTKLVCNEVDNIVSTDEIIKLVQNAKPEIVITKEMELPAQAIEAFPSSVKLICEAGTGYNNIPVELARDRGISVANIPSYSNESVAHMVITYIMNFGASIFDQAKMLHKNDRKNFTVFQHPINEITGKTLGMIGGSGTIGTCVADVALPLGMNVLISSRKDKLPSGHIYENNPRVKVVPFDEIFRQSDFVSINCPLNAETRHSVGEREIKMMKPTAFLINTARGAIINEAELIDCMKRNVIAGAGLDTQEIEPPLPDSDIWNLENIFLTPHIGWRRLETRQRLVDMTVDNIETYVKGEMKNIVN
uniref:Glycerate dehydrogenase n=1 Tax=Chaetoceros debilis TaxID=122233 RepID=A0A7S3PTN8_9STRA|mmetsp:Transcript_24042/g.36668  ORF Transcript_24042/g.36668 Transcript_24042/m.36668 type:complete len:340 (-) Transcript_24042:125-1144(-)|eukprot:CAMPEP_0194118106 /NCGR_PEP_ID=MMETSP0150-20130528/34140_1 /TAXON_ID=122233 /ORGANISM="Chaetoceros debilis, Strain MM31A-1" /LENGTH=339 /DNA_ID=CAMNT_0038809377 /DNA_START=93 /DNA_END=1112 /DNA_ORIENTATION=-